MESVLDTINGDVERTALCTDDSFGRAPRRVRAAIAAISKMTTGRTKNCRIEADIF